jgi:phage terminase large subunit-like protein
LLGVTPLLEAGHVTFDTSLNPNSPGWSPERGALVHELEDFPFAKNDDLCDCFSQGIGGARDQILDAELNEPEILFNVGGSEEADGYLW